MATMDENFKFIRIIHTDGYFMSNVLWKWMMSDQIVNIGSVQLIIVDEWMGEKIVY